MKVPHGQVEECRANPTLWVRRELGLSSGEGFATRGFNAALRDAILAYHKSGSANAAHKALSYYLRNFKDASRKGATQVRLANYILWHTSSSVIVAHIRIRLSYPLGGDILLGGEVARLDVDPLKGRYTAVLIGDFPTFNPIELRWPLIQLAISKQFARDAGLISVGVQNMDGSNLVTQCFTKTALATAQSDATSMSSEIQDAIALLSR